MRHCAMSSAPSPRRRRQGDDGLVQLHLSASMISLLPARRHHRELNCCASSASVVQPGRGCHRSKRRATRKRT